MEIRKQCILLVDDEPHIITALGREIEDWVEEKSMEVLQAFSAKQGLELLEKRAEDTVIVVSDLKMPEMKGSDFLMLVKEKYPHIISILLTGYSETQEVVKAVSAGIFSYILKPWNSVYLLAEIQKAYEHGEILREKAQYLKLMEEELKWAGEMQKAILKPNLPRSDGVEFRVSYRPVSGLYCGGDYYDVIFLGADRYLLLIGDVAGHGVKAAFVTGILKAVIYPEYVRAVVGRDFSPGAFLTWLNERMNFEFRSTSSMIITFFAGVVDLKAMLLKYANAGHNHPFIVRAGVPTELPVSGTGLGFARSVSYPEQTLNVLAGDLLLLYTDGLVEIASHTGKPEVKLKALLESITYGADYHRRIMEGALASVTASDFTDDVTLVTARIL
ncbi:MAG: fused response regulator/phosphatase [Treponemataceae bacterium]